MLTVADEGKGFDWTPYLEIRPERVFDLHGRGIAVSRMTSFDAVEYRGRGNEVELTVLCGADRTAVAVEQTPAANAPIPQAA